jgi:5-methylcytosine-specific restriction endonuclease McrA
MTVPASTRQQVRQRAGFACEFCGVGETDTGGLLTVDHFQPKSKGGADDLDNLIYCCPGCNGLVDRTAETPGRAANLATLAAGRPNLNMPAKQGI